MSKKTRLIAISGAFATGKSTVARLLKKKGIPVISTDAIYHRLLKTNDSLKKKLVKRFGRQILKDGQIDRGKLKYKVFSPSKKKTLIALNKITHPFIIEELKERIRAYSLKTDILIVEVPLLYEANLRRIFDEVIVVSSFLHTQIRRALDSGYTKLQILRLLRHQLPLEKKKKRADWVIDNVKSLKELEKMVDEVHKTIITGRRPQATSRKRKTKSF